MSKYDYLKKIPNLTDSKYPPAVVGDMSYSGLGLARALGRHGVPVIAFSPIPDEIGLNSRFVVPVICPNVSIQEDKFLEFLKRLVDRLGRRSVFFPTGDNTVLFLAKYAEELQSFYDFVIPDTSLVRQLVGKESVFGLCVQHQIPTPRTVFPRSKDEMLDAVKYCGVPCIIKPILSPLWWTEEIAEITKYGKVLMIDSFEHARMVYDQLEPLNKEFIVQEIIPGSDERLFYFVFYVNRDGVPLVTFAGQKLRVTPVHFGSASYVKSVHNVDLELISLKMLKSTGYFGLGGIEFKLDPRDNTFKLIEFNARFGLWDILTTKCGIDLPWIAYLDARGLPVPNSQDYEDGVIWVSLTRDLSAFKQYRSEGALSFFKWLKSLKGKRYGASFAWDDPKPGIREAFMFLKMKAMKAKSSS